MSYNYSLKYRTFDTLLADASNDFQKYQLQNAIDPQDMIKVALRVNYDLGLRLNQTKEIILEVENGKVRLPNTFHMFNFALLCGTYERKIYNPQGTNVEERIISPGTVYQQAPPNIVDVCQNTTPVAVPCDPCNKCGTPCCDGPCSTCNTSVGSCSLTCKGETTQLVQTLKFETRQFSVLKPIRMLENPQMIDCNCPNLYWESAFTGWIKDGWLFLNFKTGKVYLNYQSALEDDDGNILVPDHPMLNEYYEYALKQRILENLIMDDEVVSQTKIQLIESRYKEARLYAKSIVNTPNFEELHRVWKMNRKAMYSRYYDMFASYPIQNFNITNINASYPWLRE